jgi:hypothetical protein
VPGFTNAPFVSSLQTSGLITLGTNELPTTGYTSNLGALSNKFLAIYGAELWVETLVAQQTIATIGGRVLVAPTNILSADLSSGATTITVKYNNFNNGDRIYMEAAGSVEFMAVTSGAGGSAGVYTYSVTRNLDGTGANNWSAGDAVLDTGTTGNGFIDLYSTAGVLSGSGPTIVGNVRTGTAYNAIAPRWAIGNRTGVYGYGADTYGTAMGDASATNITIDATNGLRIRSGTTNKLVADTSGNLSLTGDLTMSTSGVFHSNGASAFGTGTGWWLDYNGGTPRFRVGDPAGSQMSWDGSTATLKAGMVTIDSTGIALIPANTFSAWSSGNAYRFTDSGYNMGMFALDDGSTTGVIISDTVGIGGRPTEIVLQAATGGNSARITLSGNGGFIQLDNNTLMFDHNYFYPGYNDSSTVNSNWYLGASSTLGGTFTDGIFQAFGWINAARGYLTQAGDGGAHPGNIFNIQWGANAHLWIDSTDVGQISIVSDRRMKKNIARLPSALSDVVKLKPVTFNWIDPTEFTTRQYGLLAQDVVSVLPDLVRNTGMKTALTPDGMLQVNYIGLIPMLVRAIQEQQVEIDQLKKEKQK